MSACGAVEEAGGLVRIFWHKKGNAHRALDDAIETKQIFEKLLALMDEKGEPVESKPLVYKAKNRHLPQHIRSDS